MYTVSHAGTARACDQVKEKFAVMPEDYLLQIISLLLLDA